MRNFRELGGWQVASFLTFQGGSPFSPLNGDDPALALQGISGFVGSAIRPNLEIGAVSHSRSVGLPAVLTHAYSARKSRES